MEWETWGEVHEDPRLARLAAIPPQKPPIPPVPEHLKFKRDRPERLPIGPYPTCGTVAGYVRHQQRKGVACEACLAASREYKVAHRRRRGIGPARKAKCGTYTGHQAHRRRGEKPCKRCRDACNDYQRERRARKRRGI